MGMGFAPTWLRQVSPLLHMTTLSLTTASRSRLVTKLDSVPHVSAEP